MLGVKESKGEQPREESRQLVYEPEGHMWKGPECGSAGPAPRTPELEAEEGQ